MAAKPYAVILMALCNAAQTINRMTSIRCCIHVILVCTDVSAVRGVIAQDEHAQQSTLAALGTADWQNQKCLTGG